MPNSSPSPFIHPWECSEFSLLDFFFIHSLHSIACVKLLIITVLILFSLTFIYLDSKEVKRSTIVWMQPDWNLPCFWFFVLLLLNRAIYYVAWICNCFTCSTPGAGYILYDKALCRANLKKLGLLTKNELLVCIFSSEVEPKIPDDFGDAPLLGTT